jgi:hypothetical protein
MTVLSAIGSYLPVMVGLGSLLGGWSLLGGLIGGLAGIWVGLFLTRQLELE